MSHVAHVIHDTSRPPSDLLAYKIVIRALRADEEPDAPLCPLEKTVDQQPLAVYRGVFPGAAEAAAAVTSYVETPHRLVEMTGQDGKVTYSLLPQGNLTLAFTAAKVRTLSSRTSRGTYTADPMRA